MCGIIGYVGHRDTVQVLLSGLERLEYRGYDSAGVALFDEAKGLQVRRSSGKLQNLKKIIEKHPCTGQVGIGHTRWATHGVPSDVNAHPHHIGNTVVVHNGIIENYLHLKRELGLPKHSYLSDTDTEIIAHLVDRFVESEGDLVRGVRKALALLKGSYAVVVLHEKYPGRLVAARKESPLVVGIGDGETFVASDVPAFLHYTRRVVFLDDGEMVVLDHGGMAFTDLEGRPLEKQEETLPWSPVMAEKSGFSHFMEKEIFEQPRAIVDTFRGRMDPEDGAVHLEECGLDTERLERIRRVVIVACGTSYHAGLVGKFWIERNARLPVEVDLASEFRYRDPLIGPEDLVLAISQSGETADTLAAVREAKQRGGLCLGICNVLGSTLTRICDGVLYTHAGPEIGVASTKAFTTQLVLLYLFALYLAGIRSRMTPPRCAEHLSRLLQLPRLVEEVLAANERIREIASRYFKATDFLYLGRGLLFPIALEGALKLKEISYVHAEGYAAGEMKHGPIALIDENLPVMALIGEGTASLKMLANLEEVRSRGGKVIAVTSTPLDKTVHLADDMIELPASLGPLDPVLWVVPLQLFAYHMAVLLGTDVDQPRNLAKSVTVE